MSQLRTITPELVDINLSYSKEFLKKYSNYLDLVGGFIKELETAIKYRKTFVSSSVIEDKKAFFTDLINKLANFNDEFSIYWHEQFQSLHDAFKADDAKEFFNKTSDSIGLITNTRNLVDDATSPVFDLVFSNTGGLPPLYLGANAYQKLSPQAKNMLSKASIIGNAVYRNNISMAQVKQQKSTDAHGVNLVCDFQHYVRARDKIQAEATQKVVEAVKKRIKLVQFYSTINDVDGFNYRNYSNNQQKMEFAKLKLNVEKAEYEVDVLANRLRQIKSRIINDKVLSIENFDAKTKKKTHTTEELDKIYGANNILTVLDSINNSLFSMSSPLGIFESKNTNAKSVAELKSPLKVDESEKKPKPDSAYSEKTKAGNSEAKKLPTTMQTAPPTISYPFYDSPDWANEILDCLGISKIVNTFIGMDDPFDSANYLKALNSLNPFGDIAQIGTTLESLFDPTKLLDQIQNFDLSSIANMFGLNIPLPPLTINKLMNPKDMFDDALQELQDQLIAQLESALQTVLNTVCPGK
jgi:hypothetical protein